MMSYSLARKNLIAIAIALVISVCLAFYGVQNGFSYREMILAISASIGLVVVFGGEFGIAFGFVLWVLTLALGYRTIEITKSLAIHPSELLLWLLLVSAFAQRHLFENSRLDSPWWLMIFVPFWALGWWPLVLGDGQWDKMLNEFRDFVLLIPLLIVAALVLNKQKYWKPLLVAFFVCSTWIAFMGVLEYWFPSVTDYFPAFIHSAKPDVAADGFIRAQFSFWGGSHATFICVMAVPFSFVMTSWWPQWYGRAMILAASALQLLAIYIGGYRSLWVIVVIQVACACLVRLQRHSVAIAVLCLVVGIGGYQFIPNTSERAMTAIAAMRWQPVDHSALDRQERATSAFEQAVANPVGSGWATAGWVHSDFLQVAVNLGILPALIFIAGYLVTLQRLFVKTRSSINIPVQGDLALGLLLAFLAAGEHLAVQGVEVLPQLVLPVWFVWALVEVWLRQRSAAPDFAYAYAPTNFHPVTNLQ